MTRTPLMAGNWKSNLNHQEAVALVQKLAWTLQDKKWDQEKSEVAVIPPFTDIRSVQTLVDGDKLHVKYGAQDVSEHDGGAYTGEISASMLAKLGCTYVVVGHSERREYHAETDATVNTKAIKTLAAGMIPIVCVGEGLEVGEAGDHVPFTLAQVDGSLADLTTEQVAGLVIEHMRDKCQVNVDLTGGWGGSARDHLVAQGITVETTMLDSGSKSAIAASSSAAPQARGDSAGAASAAMASTAAAPVPTR